MPNRPEWDLAAVIKAAVEQRLATVHTGLVCRVVSYNAGKQTAVVQPEVMRHKYAEDGSYTVVPMPQLNVIVKWMRFGPFRVVGPLNNGDRVWCEFSEVSLDRWKLHGGDTDPVDERRFNITDGVAYPGVYDSAHTLQDAPTSHMSIGADDGSASISIDQGASEVRLGDDTATDHVTLAEPLKSAVNTFAAATSTFVAALATFAALCLGPTSAQQTTFATACTAMETACSALESAVYAAAKAKAK